MDSDEHKVLWNGLKEEYLRYETLPMAVYISSKEGFFVRANNKAIELLNLNKREIDKENILKYYINPRDREGVIKRLKSKGHNMWLESETLQFKIPDGEIMLRKSLRYFAKPFFSDPQDPETWLGSISIVFEISEIERFRNLEQLMPVGIFEVSGDGMEVTYRNKKFDDFLWIDENYTKPIIARDFFIDESEFQNLYSKLKAGQVIKNEIVRLWRISNHSNILANLNIVPELYENSSGEKKLLRSKGFIEDITFNSFLDAPIGLYVVMRDSENEEVVTWANNEFAKINGFSNAKECLGVRIIDLYDRSEEHIYKDFLEAFENAAVQNKYLIDYRLEFVNRNGDMRQLHVHAKAIKSKRNEIIGRVGSIIDISTSGKQQLQKEVDTDYAAFLHLYRAFIHDIQTTLYSIIRGHNSSILINDFEVDIKEAFKVIKRGIKRLHFLMNSFLDEAISKNLIQDVFKIDLSRILDDLNKKLSEDNVYSSMMAKTQASDIRMSIIGIRKRLSVNTNLKNLMPSRPWKELQLELSEILRFARLISLWQMTIQAEGMFADLDILNRAISPLVDKNDGAEVFLVDDPLMEVKNDLAQYAKNERVQLTFKYEVEKENQLMVFGIKRNLYAAFYNLINNAIKYTWKKPSMVESYVVITVSNSERIEDNKLKKFVVVSFQNRGDAILKQELKNKIFQFGYRGAIALNSRKKGTGVGLWHTKKIVEEYGGRISVSSDPIAEKGVFQSRDEYNKPHITIIDIELPIKE